MDAPIPAGTLIGKRWRVAGELGEGGFGRVFEAVDESDISLGRAAVKLLHPNISPQERNAFLSEVKKIAGLRHPNLVGYLDSGQQTVDDEVHPFLVTELCVGSLSDHLANKPESKLGPAETLSVLADVSSGLDYLHQRSMIHRDIKPGNVLYAEGNWKLADFGLMRDLTATGTYHRSGQLMGTPLFMAPELFSTMTATAPSDIYALGVLAHMVGSGRPLHSGTGPALVHQITNSEPAIDPGLHPAIREFINRATALDPADRPPAKQLHELAMASVPEAASATRSVSMYPPPSVETQPSVPNAAPPPERPEPPLISSAALSSGPVSGVPVPPNAAPPATAAPVPPYPDQSANPFATQHPGSAQPTATQRAAFTGEPFTGGPFTGGPIDEATGANRPVGSQNPNRSLVPALALATIVALGALGALAYVLLRGDGDGAGGTDTATGGDPTAVNTADGSPADGTATDGASTLGTTGTSAPVAGGATPGQSGEVQAAPTVEAQEVDGGGGGGPIDLSAPVEIDGGIQIALDRQVFTFDAVAGEEVAVQVNSLNGACESNEIWDLEFSLLGPDGLEVGEIFDNVRCEDGHGPWVLPTDGQYSFVASGGEGSSSRPATGTYNVTVAKLLLLDTPVELSTLLTIDGEIAIARDRQLFSFDAVAGQRVSVQITMLQGVCESNNEWDMAVGIVDAAGQPVGEIEDYLRCDDALGPWELPSDGRYALLVQGGEGGSARPPTGSYQLILGKLQG